jgi:hypothetical protein
MSSEDRARLVAAFPSRLVADVVAAVAVMPVTAPVPPTAEDVGRIVLAGEPLRIPYRIYWAEPPPEASRPLTEQQRLILCSVYTRHHDGFVRERAIRQLVRAPDPWVMPFVVQLVGEYVLEIVRIIEAGVAEPSLAEYGLFLRENLGFLRLTRARATTYWNAYYRSEFPDWHEYPAERVLRHMEFWTV